MKVKVEGEGYEWNDCDERVFFPMGFSFVGCGCVDFVCGVMLNGRWIGIKLQ